MAAEAPLFGNSKKVDKFNMNMAITNAIDTSNKFFDAGKKWLASAGVRPDNLSYNQLMTLYIDQANRAYENAFQAHMSGVTLTSD